MVVQVNLITNFLFAHCYASSHVALVAHRSHWSPVPCNSTVERLRLRLRWPTEVAVFPLDGALHVLEDHVLLRVTPDARVQVVTGRPLHYPPPPSHQSPQIARPALLVSPQSIAFSLKGEKRTGLIIHMLRLNSLKNYFLSPNARLQH